MTNKSSISILLGADFSFSAGYPLAKTLGNNLLSSSSKNFTIISDGRVLAKETEDDYHNFSDGWLDVNNQLMNEFARRNQGEFNYERYFDFINHQAQDDDFTIKVFEGLSSKIYQLSQLKTQINSILQQLVSHFIKGKNTV